MKRRVRKKLRIGEFMEDSFEVSARLMPELSDEDRCRVFDEFVDFLTEHGLQYGGLCDPTWDGVVELSGLGTATESHRASVNDWLQSHPLVESFQVGRLFDVWR